jgi:signal transduction histidine kinase
VVQVAIGLTPLERLRQALGDVSLGRTHTLEGSFPVEVKPLVDELNTVLAQNTEIVARARTQAGNLAHALKTPLTVLGNAAAAQRSVPSPLIGDQVALARRQIDYHLKRARVAGAAGLAGVHAPLRPAVEGLLRVMRKVHARDGLAWTMAPLDDRLVFGGEQQDLQEMLGNLLDNAGKWARHRVELSATQAQGRLSITVDDDGPGIAADRREAVFSRGARDDERVPGSGLGLAIVDDLARLYSGQVELADSPLGGLRVRLHLPAA